MNKNENETATTATATAPETRAVTLTKALTALERAVETLSGVVNGNDAKASKEAEISAKKAEISYNQAFLAWLYENLAAAENPMYAAVKYGQVPAKKVKVKLDSKTNLFSVSLEDTWLDGKNTLNLIEFEAVEKAARFRNGQWVQACSPFAKTLAKGVVDGFKLSADEQKSATAAYNEAKAEGAIALLSPKAPTMNNMVKDLQQIIDGILFIETTTKKGEIVNKLKVTSRDVRYLQNIAATRGGFLNTKVVGPATMRKDVMNIIHALLIEAEMKEKDGAAKEPYTFTFEKK